MGRKPVDKAGRVQITFAVPDYVFENVQKQIGGGNVNALCKIFIHQFAAGKAGIEVSFDPRIANQSKNAA